MPTPVPSASRRGSTSRRLRAKFTASLRSYPTYSWQAKSRGPQNCGLCCSCITGRPLLTERCTVWHCVVWANDSGDKRPVNILVRQLKLWRGTGTGWSPCERSHLFGWSDRLEQREKCSVCIVVDCAVAGTPNIWNWWYSKTPAWRHCLFTAICGGMSSVVVNRNAISQGILLADIHGRYIGGWLYLKIIIIIIIIALTYARK